MENKKLCKALKKVVSRFERIFKNSKENVSIRSVKIMEFCITGSVDIEIEYNRILINEYDKLTFNYDFKKSELLGIDVIKIK